MKRITIKDIARLAGVSHSTISKALNDSPELNEQTKIRIRKIAEEMNYTPNDNARRLVSNESHTIGLIMRDIKKYTLFANLSVDISDQLAIKGYDCLLSLVEPDKSLKIFSQNRMDGILLWGGNNTELQDEFYRRLDMIDIPVVSMGGVISPYIHSVNIDRRQGIINAVEYLNRLGHRRIAYIGHPDEKAQLEKYQGYLDGVLKYGLDYDSELIIECGTDIQSGYQSCQRLLQLKNRPTAILAMSQIITVGIDKAIYDAGLSIPEDVSLISYDSIAEDFYSSVPITYVAPSTAEFVETSISLLLSRIKEKKEDPNPYHPKVSHLMVEAKLNIQRSCKNINGIS